MVTSLVSWWVLNDNSILMHGILMRPWVSIRAVPGYTKLATTRVGFFYTPIWFPVHQSLYVLLRGWLPTTDLLQLTLTLPRFFCHRPNIQKSPSHIWSFSLISPTRKVNLFGTISVVYGEFLIQHKKLLMSTSEKIFKLRRTDVSVSQSF